MWKWDPWDPTGPYGRGWKKKRAAILRRDQYLCQCDDCKLLRVPRPATEVDHKVPLASLPDGEGRGDDNLQAINKTCHERKTLKDQGARPGYGCTPDGFPLDPRHPWAQQRRDKLEALRVKQGNKATKG